jgi:hypothetical protein
VSGLAATIAYEVARELADEAQAAYDAHEGGPPDDRVPGTDVLVSDQLGQETLDADAARDTARAAWIAAVLDDDEEAEWALGGESWVGGGDGERVTATRADAESRLEDASREGWGAVDETMWVRNHARLIDPATDEPIDDGEISVTVQVDPEEPACADEHEHDWRSPHPVLGGCESNPGVWGHGGGVIIREVCAHCGAYRVTDTWAQDPGTGEQGLTSVAYEDADDDSLAWVASR